jgi:rubredoxin-NAD+ reductase
MTTPASTTAAPVVIVGAGMAAYAVARELRKLDKTTPVLLATRDAAHAYAKPMLSNAIAQGKAAAQLVSQAAGQAAAQLGIDVLAHTEVLRIHPATRQIETSSGTRAYSALVLAVGAQPVRLPLGGDAAAEVLSVNHLDDYARLREQLDALGRPAHVAILGAGLIGCEFADDLMAGGHQVTLIDPNERPLAALAAPSLSAGLASAWAGRSLTLRLGTTAREVTRQEGGLRVTLADGGTVDCDLVVSAVGLRPNTALAKEAGLHTGRGILVDGFGRTSDPAIFALGDCAEYATAGGSAVLPYVAPLLAAARAIAGTLAGTPTPILLRAEAVVVKTPSYKLALLPPPPGTAGHWVDEHSEERCIARFVDERGSVRGFGLSSHTPALRQQLLGELG